MARSSRAFTLIELLVVVAIIVLLIAILLPSLGRAREQAKTVLCSSNMRQIAQLVIVYAGQHDGRGPGGAGEQVDGSGVPHSGVGWNDILDREVLQRTDQYDVNAGQGSHPSTRTLSCPNFQMVPYTAPYGYNLDANGGPSDGYYNFNGSGEPWYGAFGMPADERTQLPQYVYAKFSYFYGAKLNRFNPYQFLILEFDYSDGVTAWSTSGLVAGNPAYLGSGAVTLGGGQQPYSNTTGSNWAQVAGEVSFRHPYYKRANFVFFDAHTETLRPKDDVLSVRRLGIPL